MNIIGEVWTLTFGNYELHRNKVYNDTRDIRK